MDEDQKKKTTIMRIGILIFMVLILGLWVLNLRGALSSSKNKLADQDPAQWQAMKDELNQTLAEVKANLSELKKLEKPPIDQAAADSLVNDLIKETDRLASSSESTSSPIMNTSTPALRQPPVTNKNCPAYIDCMPTIGETKPCQIPVGCEGITQIAY
jgi:hypothetical protein